MKVSDDVHSIQAKQRGKMAKTTSARWGQAEQSAEQARWASRRGKWHEIQCEFQGNIHLREWFGGRPEWKAGKGWEFGELCALRPKRALMAYHI